jgi:hypothetical protein
MSNVATTPFEAARIASLFGLIVLMALPACAQQFNSDSYLSKPDAASVWQAARKAAMRHFDDDQASLPKKRERAGRQIANEIAGAQTAPLRSG